MADLTSIAVDLPITLGQFVKLAGLAETGGDAKSLVASGLVRVNNEVERRRGHRLAPGDIVEVRHRRAQVMLASAPTPSPSRGGQS